MIGRTPLGKDYFRLTPPLKVLIVDDEASQSSGLAAMVSALGHDAGDGRRWP
jgi:hypothetical protein